MSFVEIILIGVGLSMDAFAVSVCKGLSMKKQCFKRAFLVAFLFGFFQALMPFLGWLLGSSFERIITPVDHWIVFALLSVLGIKMVIESFKKDDSCPVEQTQLSAEIRQLLLLAIATSIDALAVGITFAFLQVSIVPSIITIGITTLIISFFGVCTGVKFGVKFKNKAEFSGGVILLLIGLKVFLEHLGVI